MTFSQEQIQLFQGLGSMLSVILAAIAVFLAIQAERRSAKRFQVQLDLEKTIAEANAKPILAVLTSQYVNDKGIHLSNPGIGVAIITEVNFYRGDKVSKRMPDLFNLPNFKWDNYWTFSQDRYYLAPNDHIDLIRLTEDNLNSQAGFVGQRAIQILEQCQEQMKGIKIIIRYEDIFGNKQPQCERIL